MAFQNMFGGPGHGTKSQLLFGTIFRGFTYGVGFPILSGGRYDRLVEKFGKSSPATAFPWESIW